MLLSPEPFYTASDMHLVSNVTCSVAIDPSIAGGSFVSPPPSPFNTVNNGSPGLDTCLCFGKNFYRIVAQFDTDGLSPGPPVNSKFSSVRFVISLSERNALRSSWILTRYGRPGTNRSVIHRSTKADPQTIQNAFAWFGTEKENCRL